MDMKMLEKNVIECLISIEELDSRWNVTIEDIIRNNEKGRNVIEFLVAQSQREFKLDGKGPYEIQLQKKRRTVRFVIKTIENGKSDYADMELPYSDADIETDREGQEIENSGADLEINLPEDGDFPIACYGYKFQMMHEVIRACSLMPSLECSSSLCKERGKYILIFSAKKNIGDAARILFSEFTEDYFYFSENSMITHEDVLHRYSENSIIIRENALEMLSGI